MLVIDKASYHNRLTEESKTPASSWRKEKIITWLQERGVVLAENLTVPELLKLTKKFHIEKEYAVSKIIVMSF